MQLPRCTQCDSDHSPHYVEAAGPTWIVYTCRLCAHVDFFNVAPSGATRTEPLLFFTLYELDDTAHATGTVYHFCTERCHDLYLEEHSAATELASGLDGEAETDAQEICSECGMPLYPALFKG